MRNSTERPIASAPDSTRKGGLFKTEAGAGSKGNREESTKGGLPGRKAINRAEMSFISAADRWR